MPSNAQSEFARPVRVEVLEAAGGAAQTGAATPEECAALALRYDVPAVRWLRYSASAEPFGRGGWRVTGEAEAGLEQRCVVTLDPVETTVRETFDRRFVPVGQITPPAPGSELELDEDSADAPEGYDGTIDLGEIAAEAVALGIDPYPRAAGAEIGSVLKGPDGAEPLTDAAARPFAKLAALRGGGEGA